MKLLVTHLIRSLMPKGVEHSFEALWLDAWMALIRSPALELTNPKVPLHVLRSNYEEIEVDIDGVILTYPIPTIPDSIGRQQNTKFVSKQGMYDLILQSRKK